MTTVRSSLPVTLWLALGVLLASAVRGAEADAGPPAPPPSSAGAVRAGPKAPRGAAAGAAGGRAKAVPPAGAARAAAARGQKAAPLDPNLIKLQEDFEAQREIALDLQKRALEELKQAKTPADRQAILTALRQEQQRRREALVELQRQIREQAQQAQQARREAAKPKRPAERPAK